MDKQDIKREYDDKEIDEERRQYIIEKYGVTDEEEIRRYDYYFSGEKVTREYLLETYGITEEDLEGTDLEAVVEYDELYIRRMKSFKNKEEVLIALRHSQKRMEEAKSLEENSKAYLLEAEEYKGEFPDIKTIKYLIFEFDTGECTSEKRSTLIDFEENTLYYDGATTVKKRYLNAETIVKISDSQKEIVLERLAGVGIDEWEYYYNEQEKGRYYSWDLGMEFEDGTVITKHGDLSDKGKPNTMDELLILVQDIRRNRLN